MNLKKICLISSAILLTGCYAVRDKMDQLKTFDAYATPETNVKNNNNALKAELDFVDGRSLKTKIMAQENIFYKTLQETSINKSIAIYDNKGKVSLISYKLLNKLTLIDFKGKERVFINRDDKVGSLYEVMYDGHIKWYRYYYPNLYDWSVMSDDLFVSESGEEIGRKGFTGFRGNLIKVTAGKPEFKEKIESIKKLKKEAVIEILKEYDH